MPKALDNAEGSVFAPLYALVVKVMNDYAERLRVELATQRPWSRRTPNRHSPYRVNATGKTSDSIEVVPTADGVQLLGRADFMSVERGVEPGSRPSITDLMEWANARGLNYDNDTIEFIADKITSQGDDLFNDGGREPFVTDLLDEAEQTVYATVDQAIGEGILTEGVLREITIFSNI